MKEPTVGESFQIAACMAEAVTAATHNDFDTVTKYYERIVEMGDHAVFTSCLTFTAAIRTFDRRLTLDTAGGYYGFLLTDIEGTPVEPEPNDGVVWATRFLMLRCNGQDPQPFFDGSAPETIRSGWLGLIAMIVTYVEGDECTCDDHDTK